MILYLAVVAVVGPGHPGLDHVRADATVQPAGKRVRGRDPAVRVRYVGRQRVHDAVDWVADVLARGHDQRARRQQDDGGLVVQFEHVVVDCHVVHLQQAPDRAEQVDHRRCRRGCRKRERRNEKSKFKIRTTEKRRAVEDKDVGCRV